MDFLQWYIVQAIDELFGQAVEPEEIPLQQTRKDFEGDITLVVFPYTRFSKKSPEQTGELIGSWLKEHVKEIETFNVVKGFLNLMIADSYWLERVKAMEGTGHYGYQPGNGRKVMIEYSSPNTNKPLHLGHIRNNLLGYSVSRILEAAGYEVIKANLVNDRGIHICKSMLAWQKFGKGETPGSAGMKGDHLVGKYYVRFDQEYKKQVEELRQGLGDAEAKTNAPLLKEAQELLLKWEQGDPEVKALWEKMNGWVYEGFDITYRNLGVSFDKYYYESDTYLLGKDVILEGLETGVFFRKPDGSVWVDLREDGLHEKLLLRADGTSVYITQDLGTAQLKFDDFKMDQSVYVVGNEQDYHFKVLFLILKKLGRTWAEGLHHLSYGMVDLPTGKMKSREGTVVDADDLIDEMIRDAREHTEKLGKVAEMDETERNELYRKVGLGALKYFLLKVDPKKRLLFNPEESVDLQGHTGPFIQYTYARICSVLKKAGYKGTASGPDEPDLNADEKALTVLLNNLPEIIREASSAYNPAVLANYLYELAKTYNKFYHDNAILRASGEQQKQFRLQLSVLTARTIKNGMELLGIEVPERM